MQQPTSRNPAPPGLRFVAGGQAALEQIEHALAHFALQHESDRRQVLISLDAAIELTALAWIRRNVALKREIDDKVRFNGRARAYIERCVKSFSSQRSLLSLDSINHAHGYRNELYHEGKVHYPDLSLIELAKVQCLELYRLVFGTDARDDLRRGERSQPVHEQVAFLAEIQTLTETLWALCDVHPEESLHQADEARLIGEWRTLEKLQEGDLPDKSSDFSDLLQLRNRLIVKGLSALQDVESRLIRGRARELHTYLERYTSSVSILTRSSAAYVETPFRDDLKSLRLCVRGGSVLVRASFADGSSKEEDLDYFQGQPECVNEAVRFRTVMSDEHGNVTSDTIDLQTIKNVKVGKLFSARDGLRAVLDKLWDLDDMGFAMAVDCGARELPDGLPANNGRRSWPAKATSLSVLNVQVEQLDAIYFNPHPFISVKIGPDAGDTTEP